MDKSALLDQVLKDNKFFDRQHKRLDPRPLLGELQFAFVCFLVGHIFDAFDQWKRIFSLLCSCQEALKTYSVFFEEFLDVAAFQMREIPADFFVDILSGKNFLSATLTSLFDNLEDSSLPKSLADRGALLRRGVETRFGRSFSVEDLDPIDDDNAPTIVE